MNRREFFTVTGAGALARGLSAAEAKQTAPSSPGILQAENAKPGALDWQLTRVRVDKAGFRSPWIEGYCSKQSVKAGESIAIHVSTEPARKFRMEVFRMGYYGGRGARKMSEYGPLEGRTQAAPKPGD